MHEIICRECGVGVPARGTHGIYCIRCSLDLMSQLDHLESRWLRSLGGAE